jgi:DNA-damage-inducible protein D
MDKNSKTLFDSIKNNDNASGEFWSARDLQKALEYSTWEKFTPVIEKAKVSFRTSKITASTNINDHFRQVVKMVEIGSGTIREIDDIQLSKYACYLIAQNGDPRKKPIALAQSYFNVQTFRQEQADIELAERHRLEAREKYRESDKKLSTVVKDRDVSPQELATIKSNGDKVLFGGHNTREMKAKMGINPAARKPLVDVLPTISITAKQLANEMTHVNTVQKDLRGFPPIDDEHKTNNKTIRDSLLTRGIKLEELQPEEDIAKIERRILKRNKQLEKDK